MRTVSRPGRGVVTSSGVMEMVYQSEVRTWSEG